MENVTLSQSTFIDGMIQRLSLRGRGRSVAVCGCTAQFLSDLVGHPEDRFSSNNGYFNILDSTLQYYLGLYQAVTLC